MNDKQQSVLNILQEECAEVIQVVSKIRRFGLNEYQHNTGITNKERLAEEIGDLLCMIQLLTEHGLADNDCIEAAKLKKIEKLKIWSNIYVE